MVCSGEEGWSVGQNNLPASAVFSNSFSLKYFGVVCPGTHQQLAQNLKGLELTSTPCSVRVAILTEPSLGPWVGGSGFLLNELSSLVF